MGVYSNYERNSMSVEIRVPSTGNAGEEAVVLEISATLGAAVREGEVVALLETAKATFEVESPVSGTVLAVNSKVGDELPEHSVMFVIGEPGEIISGPTPVSAPAPAEPAVDFSNRPAPTQAVEQSPVVATTTHVEKSLDAPGVSPRARTIAEQSGIDVSNLTGSGPNGRIIAKDVPAAAAAGLISEKVQPSPYLANTQHHDSNGVSVLPVRGSRKVTAQRMASSLAESAQLTLNRYSRAEALISLNSRLRKETDVRGLPKISINDMINFAVARTLPDYQDANSIFSWEGIQQFPYVNLGVAVDTGKALLVPVIFRANELSLAQLAAQTRSAADRARNGELALSEMENGTFTVTNLGMYGIHWFTPILNPPQSCILGVGAIHQPSPDSPALLPLSLTFDHRALDGAAAARALAAISEAIENIDILGLMSFQEN
jgi:pyruvate dehydrogenase E2 component (dihydrolipoamide acetyltransferase)